MSLCWRRITLRRRQAPLYNLIAGRWTGWRLINPIAVCHVGCTASGDEKNASRHRPDHALGMRFAVAAVFYGLLTWHRKALVGSVSGLMHNGLFGRARCFQSEFISQALARLEPVLRIPSYSYTPRRIFTAGGPRVLLHERLNGAQWGGIALAIQGRVTTVSPPSDRSWASLIGWDAVAILAGAAWGLNKFALRMGKVSGAAIAKTIFYQVGMGGVILIGFAYINATTHVHWTPSSIPCRPTRPSV